MELRQSGIDIVGKVSWGTHFCQFYETNQDLIETLVPYFREGLAANEFCMWITSAPLQVNQATEALRSAVPDLDKYLEKGQIEILDYRQWYTRSGRFSAEEVLQSWIDKLNESLNRGFEGLRLTGNTFWLEESNRDDFIRYEKAINTVIGKYRMLAVCTYCLPKCSALEILDVVANHQFALIKRSGLWQIIENSSNKEMKQELQEANERLDMALIGAGAGTWDWNVITGHIEWSTDLFTIFGLDPQINTASFKSWNEVLHHQDREYANSMIERSLKDRTGLNSEYRIIRPDGSIRWINALGKGTYDGDRPIRMTGICIDITKRKMAEETLQRSEEDARRRAEELAKLMDLTPSAVWVSNDPQCKNITGNEAANRFYEAAEGDNLSAGAIGGMQDSTRRFFQNGHELKPSELPMQIAAAKGIEVKDSEVDVLLPSGKSITILGSARPLFEANGKVRGSIAAFIDITNRKQAEEAINAERNQLLSIFNSINESIYISDMDTYEIIYANKAIQKSFGQKLIGEICYKVLQGKDKPCEFCTNPIIRGLNRQPYQWEFHNTKINKDFQIVDRMIRWPDGRDVRFEIAIDITERKQAEESLRKSEEKFRLVADFTSDWETWLSPTGDYIYVSPSSEHITGHRAEEFMENPHLALELVHPDDKCAFENHQNIHYDSQAGINNLDFRIITANGEVKWIGHVCKPVFGKNKEWLGCRTSNRDITWRKQIESDLMEAQNYLENLIDYANAPIIVWDTSFNITRFNRAFEELTGLKADEVLGKPLEILFPEESKEASMQYIGRTIYGEHWEVIEMPILNIDSSVRIVLWNTANIYNKEKTEIIATIAQGQDITERKQAEEQLRKARDDLELKVLERTTELQSAKDDLELSNKELHIELETHQKLEAELVKAKEAAEEAANAKAAFLANMSHELRTPMNAVIGFTSLLMDDNITSAQQEYIEGIRSGGEALLALVNDILDFSKTDRDKLELEHQPISLRHCIEEAMDLVATQANKKNLNLAYTVCYGTPDIIIGDHGRLRQVLVNLLGNAVKFTDKGGITVSVSAKSEGNKSRIHFNVSDTGIGISENKLDTIFEPFSQVERVISRMRDGVGLGLAISKRLVELMDGKIWAESIPGKGSTFYFTILAEVVLNRDLLVEQGRMDSSESLASHKPLSILIAEDNPSNQRVLVEMLKRMGYRPDAVSNGKEVLQALELRPFDLIFMDIKMPEMDGITASREICKRWPENRPKIIAVTAYALEGDREICLKAGMDDYIAKPILKKELIKVLTKYSQ